MSENFVPDNELQSVSGGIGNPVGQYEVKINHAYWIYFPMQDGPLIMNPYGSRSGHKYRIMVYRVYEEPGLFFGLNTNRTVDGIDMDNGEYVTVCVNANNVWEL